MLETKIKVDLRDVEELARRFPKVSVAAAEAKATEALQLLEREVISGTPYGAGPIHLRETIHGKVRTMGRTVVGILGTPLEHGEPVELGTKPHFPPLGPIQFWVEKKLGYMGKEAESVAFLVARAISRRGTKGAQMFENAFEDNEYKVVHILNEIPEEIVRRI